MTKGSFKKAAKLDADIEREKRMLKLLKELQSGKKQCQITIYAHYNMYTVTDFELSYEDIEALYEIRKNKLDKLQTEFDELLR